MNHTNILKTPHEVDAKLSSLGITKNELKAVALEAIAAKNNASPIHPISAPGTYSYMAGVAALRMILLPKEGWEIDRTNNMEGTHNSDLNVTILFQNVDCACGVHDPKAISGKGDGARKLLEQKSEYIWKEMEAEDQANEEAEANKSVWFFCVSSDGEDIKAELSLPNSIKQNQFNSFAERIFVITESDNEPLEKTMAEERSDDFDLVITKKQ